MATTTALEEFDFEVAPAKELALGWKVSMYAHARGR